MLRKNRFVKNIETIVGRIGGDINKACGAIGRFLKAVESEMCSSREVLDHVEQFCDELDWIAEQGSA